MESQVTSLCVKEFSSVVLWVSLFCHFNKLSIFTNSILIITADALDFIFYIFWCWIFYSDISYISVPHGAARWEMLAGRESRHDWDGRLEVNRRHAPQISSDSSIPGTMLNEIKDLVPQQQIKRKHETFIQRFQLDYDADALFLSNILYCCSQYAGNEDMLISCKSKSWHQAGCKWWPQRAEASNLENCHF